MQGVKHNETQALRSTYVPGVGLASQVKIILSCIYVSNKYSRLLLISSYEII
jgi:hypothetical protein